MQFSTKVRYAVRAMVQLTIDNDDGPVRLKEIAEKQDISLKYLEQVMAPLRSGKYVKTVKGNRGGYMLLCKPEDVTLYDIICCVEGDISPVSCAETPDSCARAHNCAVHPVWVRIKDLVNTELKRISISDLAKNQTRMGKN